MAVRNTDASINRLEIEIARKQKKKDKAALEQGFTARASTCTKRVVEEASPSEPKRPRTKQDEAEQRVVIKYFYKKLGWPPEEDWDGHFGTVSEIRRMMGHNGPGAGTVRRTLEVLAEGYMDVMINAERHSASAR